MGTSAIAANAVTGTIANWNNLPGFAINLAIVSVVSVCVGAGRYDQARYYTRRLCRDAMIGIGCLSIILYLSAPILVTFFNLGPDAAQLTIQIVRIHAVASAFLWMPAFGVPNTLRAAGDVVWPMSVAIFSMWVFLSRACLRIHLCCHFGRFPFGWRCLSTGLCGKSSMCSDIRDINGSILRKKVEIRLPNCSDFRR